MLSLIHRKASGCLQDQLNSPFATPLTEDIEALASTLKRTLWSASLSCLVAAVSATQTQERAYNFFQYFDPLSRFLPTSTIAFSRRV